MAGHTVIVGAGPTGMALALALARRGLPVTLLESQAGAGAGFRGEALMPSGMEALAALDLLPLDRDVRQRPLQGWSFWLQRRRLFACEEPLAGAHPCTLVDPEGLLRSWQRLLRQRPSARLLPASCVTGPVLQDGRVVGVRLADGQTLAADLVVACNGRRSELGPNCGLTLEQAAQPIDVLWFRLAGEAAEELADQLAGRFHTLIGDAGSLALFASSRGGVQLGWPLPGDAAISLSTAQWRARWQQLAPPPLARALGAVPLEAIEGPLRQPVRVGLARRWWCPGLLLLGDAAHPMSPIRAQGTSMALRDVVSAAAVLPAALSAAEGTDRTAALDAALEAIEACRRPEIVRIQALQQQEWQRGERLGHNRTLRQLLAGLAPGLAPLLAAIWSHGQRDLRLGLADGVLAEPP